MHARFTTRVATALAAALAAVVAVAAPASAHPGHGLDSTTGGFLHPFTGPDHLLAMVAVGVVAATAIDRRMSWLAPAAFVGGMLVGGAAGLTGVPVPGTEPLIVASVILLGLAVAGALDGVGPWLAVAIVVAGFAHGHAHGAEAPAAVHPAWYVGGFVAATVTLHATGAGLGTLVRNRRTVRLGMGLATVAAGALLLV